MIKSENNVFISINGFKVHKQKIYILDIIKKYINILHYKTLEVYSKIENAFPVNSVSPEKIEIHVEKILLFMDSRY